MNLIIKNSSNPELKNFFDWLQTNTEKDEVSRWLREKSISEVWKKLIENTPAKKSLQNGLLQEQYHLCCYCCCPISNEIDKFVVQENFNTFPVSVEHYLAKETNKELVFWYDNLHISCKTTASCNLKRNNNPLIYINPQNINFVRAILLKRETKGKELVILQSNKPDLLQEIEVILGLNHHNLKIERGKVIEAIEKTAKEIDNDVDKKQKLIEQFCTPNQQGKLYPFSFVAEWYINQNYL